MNRERFHEHRTNELRLFMLTTTEAATSIHAINGYGPE